MIKAVYTYKTLTANLGELLNKFAQSADPKFDSTPTNVKIEMSERVENEYTFVRLDIYYQSFDDFEQRRNFELSHKDWQEIWFNDARKDAVDLFFDGGVLGNGGSMDRSLAA